MSNCGINVKQVILKFKKYINIISMHSLIETLPKIKAIIFDMDGVLRIGQYPIKGSEKIFPLLKEKNIKSMILTNECRFTTHKIKDDLESMGINILDTPIYTAGICVYKYLLSKFSKSDLQFTVGIIGEIGLIKELEPLRELDNVNIEELPPKYNSKLFLVIGTVNNISIPVLEKAIKWVKAGAKIILTCKDMSDPSSKGDFSLGMPSHILHLINYNLKTKYYALGKPSPFVANYIFKYYPDLDPEEILFVGDTISTDIRLAEESGMRSLLVLSGNTKKEALKQYVTEPDFILNSINDLVKIF